MLFMSFFFSFKWVRGLYKSHIYEFEFVARCRFQTDKELISLKEKRTALSKWLVVHAA